MKIILEERKTGFFVVFIQNDKGELYDAGIYSPINKGEAKTHAVKLAEFLGVQLIETKIT